MHSFNGLHTVFILSRGQSLHVGVLITSVPLPILRPKNYQVLDYKLFLITKKQTLGDAISRTIYITSYFYNRVELNSKFLFSINFEPILFFSELQREKAKWVLFKTKCIYNIFSNYEKKEVICLLCEKQNFSRKVLIFFIWSYNNQNKASYFN